MKGCIYNTMKICAFYKLKQLNCCRLRRSYEAWKSLTGMYLKLLQLVENKEARQMCPATQPFNSGEINLFQISEWSQFSC